MKIENNNGNMNHNLHYSATFTMIYCVLSPFLYFAGKTTAEKNNKHGNEALIRFLKKMNTMQYHISKRSVDKLVKKEIKN